MDRPTLLDLLDRGGNESVGEAKHMLEEALALELGEDHANFEEFSSFMLDAPLGS